VSVDHLLLKGEINGAHTRGRNTQGEHRGTGGAQHIQRESCYVALLSSSPSSLFFEETARRRSLGPDEEREAAGGRRRRKHNTQNSSP